jgi:hypothetical protein
VNSVTAPGNFRPVASMWQSKRRFEKKLGGGFQLFFMISAEFKIVRIKFTIINARVIAVTIVDSTG